MASYSVIFGLLIMLSFGSLGLAKVYTVGESDGWTFGVDYDAWTSGKTFKVGDKLVFNYDKTHTVELVNPGDYKICAAGKSTASYDSGTTTLTLNTTGPHYFICKVMAHCASGMKLTVDVTGAAVVSPSPAPSPTPNGSPSDAPSPVTAYSPTKTPSGKRRSSPTVAGTSIAPTESSSLAIMPSVGVVYSLVVIFISRLFLLSF